MQIEKDRQSQVFQRISLEIVRFHECKVLLFQSKFCGSVITISTHVENQKAVLPAVAELSSITKPIRRTAVVNISIFHSVPHYLQNSLVQTTPFPSTHKAERMTEKKKRRRKKGNYVCKHTGAFWKIQWCQIHIGEHLPLKTNLYYFLPQW